MKPSTLSRFKVTVLGASGAIGQPLALALVQNKRVSELALYDIVQPRGVAVDLSHFPRKVKVTGYPTKWIHKALDGADLVLMSAGMPRRPGMTHDDLFNTNALTVNELSAAVARYAPKSVLAIISNPLNSMVPVAAETLQRAGVYDPRKLFGIISLNMMRARKMLGDFTGQDPEMLDVPVIGGHSGQTIVPLFSHSGVELRQEQVEYLTHRVRVGGDEVVKAKEGRGSSSLSMAFAAAEWADGVLRAMDGEKTLLHCSFVESPLFADKCRFFGSTVEVGKEGIERVLPLPSLNEYEEQQLDRCLPDLEKNIRKGLVFVAENAATSTPSTASP
ncbi:malate dehydrogenase [Leishmania donovani]|uniref:malate dehydrogenase n=3 Tax=Leishmania donovani species complex TaxID=38574 RepID=A0A6L0XQ15_LEIIN|nr:putative malate dehydrogenase [Leishmania infantum JPCM5]XP_003864181.1 malate dehydrogenase, putative [Leishmania donovani]CAC9535770.1 malate_dehydrogenase_-_putative [Leishmania infantum]AYU82348.1 malate dehydrogenase, putative [Leishmania donovani]TPP39930.1 malate dehydrogenase, NAD-dependent [Leishmania donovani]TPP50521.1 malate dehydrogenase, NAD-dependent [Leishmania donovani]CAJ1992348.1 malate dehydrogenase [Leishmania donovani]|eukprot:XP_001468403.1 putative malate dehydrogenase [Leishmania infantum JPCM5]